ncbi:MAG: S41 family peptidase [Alphaproteobacteria bacterium]|nr:S41 family peptidase [Alphaproteobacteria bacterium]MBM3732535.1 S41 family peptidase [Acidimicrobiia bacterium]
MKSMTNHFPRTRGLRTTIVVAGAVAAGVALGALGGCSVGDGVLGRAIGWSDLAGLSADSSREVERFNVALRRESDKDGVERATAHFTDVFKRVRVGYVREVGDAELVNAALRGLDEEKGSSLRRDPGKLVEAALRAMLSSLDPHSAYLNADEYRDSFVSTRSEFGGIGIEVSAEDGLVKIIAPIEDTPAYRAGLKSGDLITQVDGEPVKGKGLMYAVNKMRGAAGSEIRLTLIRGGASFEARLTRAVIKVRSVRWEIVDDVGYIRVVRFIEKVDDNLDQAVAEVRKQLGGKLRGIVLDLRNNPGGLLEQSVTMADSFLDSGKIVTVKGRRGAGRVYEAVSGDIARGIPMVVLINGGSASAAEIVAAALQQNGRATVMGTLTFGKGSVQTVVPLPQEGAIRLTTSLYYAPSGEAIQSRGVEPDVEVIDTAAEAEKDKSKSAESAADKRRREADLPGALPAVGSVLSRRHGSVPDSRCRPVGEKQDRQLGCAVELLQAGSAHKFLAAAGARPAM